VPEALSTARPTPLRFAGFLAITLGGVLVGLGSLLDWAVVGFPGSSELDVATRGIDVREGVVTLAIGATVLVLMIVVRLLTTDRSRRVAAAAIVVLGLAAASIAAADAAGLQTRFAATDRLPAIARGLARALDLPAEQVLATLRAEFADQLRVDAGIGLWLVIGGGIAAAAGGVLTLAWARRERPTPGSPRGAAAGRAVDG
jgi:hypothetical protein